MSKRRSFQLLVVAISAVILIGLCIIVYLVYLRPDLTLRFPTGGEEWSAGDTYPIRWAAGDGIQNVRLEYSTGGGFETIGQAPAADGAYDWQVPRIESSSVRVRISSADDASVNDVSDPFAITVSGPRAALDLTSPQAGAQWPAGSQQAISWTAGGITEDLSLEYTLGGAYLAIGTVPAQPGTYAWIVPNTPSNQAQVRISTTDGSGSSAASGVFAIVANQPTLSLTSPQGREEWSVGSTQRIRWTSANASGDVRLKWAFDGRALTDIGDPIPIGAGMYTWTVEPICKPFTENARIVVESLAHPGVSAANPQPFIITSPALRADAGVCLPQGRCYVTNDPAISAGAGHDGTIAAPWLLTGSEAIAGPGQDEALREFRWALYEPLVCDRLGNGPFELIAVLCTGAQCTTNRCQFAYDAQGRVVVDCFPKEPGLPAGWGVALPFPYVLTGGLVLGGLSIVAGFYLRRRARD